MGIIFFAGVEDRLKVCRRNFCRQFAVASIASHAAGPAIFNLIETLI
jgi:hypothetical protein